MERRAAAAISAVFDNDDLLREILLRLAFPTSLVRAALFCKRWLRLVSALAFLRHFRDLNPPQHLGFYVTTDNKILCFVPMPQPPELASVVTHASFDLDSMGSHKLDLDYCWNGHLFITIGYSDPFVSQKRSVHCPLYPTTTRHIATLPPLGDTSTHDGFTYYNREILPNAGSNDGLPYFCLALGSNEQQSVFDVYVLQDDTWVIYSSVITEIPQMDLALPSSLIANERIYNLAYVGGTYKLVSLDLLSSCLSLVNLPEEVELLRTDLSLENDSEVHLIHVNGSQLRIWLYMLDNNGCASWLRVNTICLHEICANHIIPTSVLEYVGASMLMVNAVGGNSGLFFLEKDGILYLFDMKRKTVNKVFEVTQEDKCILEVKPFMMVGPPIFPVMKEESDPKE